jgi:hypothetical protein
LRRIDPGRDHLVDPASSGIPKPADARQAVLDAIQRTATFKDVKYDLTTTTVAGPSTTTTSGTVASTSSPPVSDRKDHRRRGGGHTGADPQPRRGR